MSQIKKINVLIVDDSVTIRNVITKHLGDDYSTIHACNGEEAWQLIQSNNAISLIFADLHMPVMNGMVLLKQIRDSDCERIANLPVIMITGHEDSDAAKSASYNMGATDFVSKPFSEFDISSRAGSYTKLNQKIASLEQNVTHDSLTGLINKRGFNEQGEIGVAAAHRHQFELSMLTLQVAGIEEVLKKHGNKVAAQIIISVAERLKETLRKEETLAHLGSGRYAMLLPMTKAFKAHIVAIRFQKAITNLAFQTDDEIIRIQLAVGLNSTEGYNQPSTFSEMYLQAENALQESLQRRACQIVRHDETLKKDPYTNKDIESSLNATSEDIISDNNVQESIADDLDGGLNGNLQKLSPAVFSRYMSEILNGNFENVPVHHIDTMVESLEEFLKYAYDQKQIELKKINTAT